MIIHSSILMHAFIHSFIHSFINSSIHSSHTSKHRICNYCITMLHVTSRSGSHLIRYEHRPTKVRRPAHEGLKAASCQTEPGEKNVDEPQQPLPNPAQKRIGTSRPFSFNPNLRPSPQNSYQGEASGTPESLSRVTRASARRRVKEQWDAT